MSDIVKINIIEPKKELVKIILIENIENVLIKVTENIPEKVTIKVNESIENFKINVIEQQKEIVQIKVYEGGNGTAGKDGATWYFAETNPINTFGKNGDFFLNSISFDNFNKIAGVWSLIGNSKGANGNDGQPGETPYIGENLNWWIGNVDTGIKAQGNDGTPGTDGKTAYESAQSGGYVGTENQFNTDLSQVSNKQNILVSTTYTLLYANWSNYQYILSVPGMTTTKIFFISPAENRTDWKNFGDYEISVISQTTDSITLQCTYTPTVNINIVVCQ